VRSLGVRGIHRVTALTHEQWHLSIYVNRLTDCTLPFVQTVWLLGNEEEENENLEGKAW